jgi:hypothetical protein
MEKSNLVVMGLLLILKLRHAIEECSGGSIGCLYQISFLLQPAQASKKSHREVVARCLVVGLFIVMARLSDSEVNGTPCQVHEEK